MSNQIERITHRVDGSTPLKIVSKKGQIQDIIVQIEGEGQSDIDVVIEENAHTNLFFINLGNELNLTENFSLHKDAHLNVSYADFNEAKLVRNANFSFDKEGSVCFLKSAILVQSEKIITYRFEHIARNTFGDMKNFAVTVDEGSLKMHVIGHIKDKSALTETHQSTRVLNYNSTQKAQVFPELIIENNDVKASHAQSSGQIDANQLYYLQSRGLSTSDAIRLIVKGYLSSILDTINDETLHYKLMLEIDQKVERVCSM